MVERARAAGIAAAMLCGILVAGNLAGSAQAEEGRSAAGGHSLTIIVKGANWGDGKPDNIKALLENVASHLTRHLREPLQETVEVTRDPRGPRILLRDAGQTTYRILLDTGDTYWAQYTYQFAHEFCHLLAGEERFRAPNQWVEETLCELAALFTLRSMAVTWKTHPPHANWRDFAPALGSYADGVIAEAQMPSADSWPTWLREHEARARADPYLRDGNLVVALRLLPLFEAYPAGWNAVRRLQTSGKRIDAFFADWKAAVRPQDRDFIAQLEAALGLGTQ